MISRLVDQHLFLLVWVTLGVAGVALSHFLNGAM
jgi:hypothetical protein